MASFFCVEMAFLKLMLNCLMYTKAWLYATLGSKAQSSDNDLLMKLMTGHVDGDVNRQFLT